MSISEAVKDLQSFFSSYNISSFDASFIISLIKRMGNVYLCEKDFYDFTYYIKEALKDENYKNYSLSADEYIKAYESADYKIPSDGKKYFEKKISKMKYNDALEYYNDKDYSSAIDKFKECINNEYMTSDIKLDCRIKLVYSLDKNGIEQYEYKNYLDACEYLEEAINIINSYCEVRNKIGVYEQKKIRNKIGDSYIEIGKQNWNHYNTNSMEAAINYFRKANKYTNSPVKSYELYYYLYKAYHESKSYRTWNLSKAKEFEDERPQGFIFWPCTSIYDVTEYYNRSLRIDNLQNTIKQKENDIRNLNYELNSVISNINNTQSKINAKNVAINNKNTAISDLNILADSLIIKGSEVNNQIEESVNEGKNQVAEVKKNIKDKKDFIEEIKKFENQKKEEIENMKNNNKTLKEKNEQLFQMLNALESRLN